MFKFIRQAMEKVELIALKKKLPRGYGSRISKTLGITRQAVSNALRRNNLMHPAITEALKIRDEYLEELTNKNKSINQ